MTIESTITTVRYAGGGSTLEYAVPFPVIDEANIRLAVRDGDGNPVPFVQGTDYAISAGGTAENPNGNATLFNATTDLYLTLLSPLPDGWTLELWREVPITQEAQFHNQGPYSPRVTENSLDKVTMICQELRRDGDNLLEAVSGVKTEVETVANALGGENDALRAAVGVLEAKVAALITAKEDVSPTLYERSERFSSDPGALRLPEYMNVVVNGRRVVPERLRYDLANPGIWDDAAMASPAKRAGVDIYVYATTQPGGIVLSRNATTPAGGGYTADNTRKIGGFHCLCVDAGTIAGHPLSGMTAGQILPASVWDLRHRPVAQPEGMVFSEKTGRWYQIYLANAYGASVYNEAFASINDTVWHTDTPYPMASMLAFIDLLGDNGMRLLYSHEFQIVAAGSNEATEVQGWHTKSGGHSDTNGRRMISDIGMEDCCGLRNLVLLDNANAAPATDWVDLPGNTGSVKGSGYILLAGGVQQGTQCGTGSRFVPSYASQRQWGGHWSQAGRGCSEPLVSI